jgi:multidrug efflux pump subunit AcrA (membrane-fusion protein)
MNNYPISLKAFDAILLIHKKPKIRYYFWIIMTLFIFLLFLPWTQNIKSKGNITTLKQEQRPQKMNALIPGKINQWFVKEGDFVKKGDTILILSEIKEDYLDPNLIGRTQSQVDAKASSIAYYKGKISTTEKQIVNLQEAKRLKIDQLKNKSTQLDSKLAGEKAELIANENETKLLKNQYDRQIKMYEEGLVSQTQLQQRSIQYQNAIAKRTTTENKIAQTQQEIINNRIEQNSVAQEYTEKINKAEGDKFQNFSQVATTQADVAKLQNQVSNYTIRNSRYVVTASQDGQMIQANKAGIGEILKEGETIALIVPNTLEYAVEMFVSPVDLPLINVGQTVRFTFDGFPAIVFSGWPEGSYGTFSGKIVAYENAIGENGKYRVLVAEDVSYKKWPKELRIGTGAQAILLLKDVPIWYELWRNINGFPPDFYKIEKATKDKK